MKNNRDIKVLDMKPIAYYGYKGIYSFHNPFPYDPFTLNSKSSIEEAYEEGLLYAQKYEKDTFPSGMASCLGVCEHFDSAGNSSYKAVITSYYSNT